MRQYSSSPPEYKKFVIHQPSRDKNLMNFSCSFYACFEPAHTSTVAVE